jgi:hypothetical protein
LLYLEPFWQEDVDTDCGHSYVCGMWLTCHIHGEIKFIDIYERIDTNELEEEIDEHLHSLHFA